jgi:hypothetical protein
MAWQAAYPLTLGPLSSDPNPRTLAQDEREFYQTVSFMAWQAAAPVADTSDFLQALVVGLRQRLVGFGSASFLF